MFYKIINDDCYKALQKIKSNIIDCVVTDPPYGIGFMGKDWDKALPKKEDFTEMYRVLKPGALAFIMSSPRQDVLWRMMQILEECGFQLQQSFISWIYKSGFPKAYDVSKGIDRKFGLEPKKIRELSSSRETRTNPLAKMFGAKTYETKPITDLAKKWEGWKSITGLKPALECILMVNKPFSEKTIVDNVLKHGTGAINVDVCRIPFQSKDDKESSRFGTQTDIRSGGYGSKRPSDGYIYDKNVLSSEKGRFPANLLVSDKALDTGKITGAGITGSGVVRQKKRGEYLPHNVYGDRKVIHEDVPYTDVGDQSRYFDLDVWAKHHGFLQVPKASKSERDKGCENLVSRVQKTTGKGIDSTVRRCPIHNEPIPSGYQTYKCGCKIQHYSKDFDRPKKNFHPTVKPLRLMSYLITLGCPRKGIVLDPYLGSGTTMIACKMLNRSCIGIEINKEYCKIAESRVNSTRRIQNLFDIWNVKS